MLNETKLSISRSVPDPKFFILDPNPDPQNESRNFGSRSFWKLEVAKKKLSILVINKTQMGKNLQVFKFVKYLVSYQDKFGNFLIHV